MGLTVLIMASYGGLEGILSGLTKSTDPPSRAPSTGIVPTLGLKVHGPCLGCRVTPGEKVYGWWPKLWPLLGSPKYWVPYYTKDPKREHIFDNHMHESPVGLVEAATNHNADHILPFWGACQVLVHAFLIWRGREEGMLGV